MTLTPEQIKKIWIAQQEISNPRYSVLTNTEKQILEKQLSNQYDENSNTYIIKNTTNFFDTSIGTNIKDDSEREPFGTNISKVSRLLNIGPSVISPETVPLNDDANNRIIWVDKTQNIDQIWYLNGPPSTTKSPFLIASTGRKATIEKVSSGNTTVDPDNLAEMYFPGRFFILHEGNNIHWIDISHIFTEGYYLIPFEPKVYLIQDDKTYLKDSYVDTNKIIVDELTNGSIDPLHPETINPNWSLESATHITPVVISSTASSPAADMFRNQGGPIISDCHLYILFIGNSWNTTNSIKRDQLIQFHIDLFNSQYMNILKQYGINSGIVSGNLTFTGVPGVVSDQNMQNLIENAISKGALPVPDAHTFYFGYLDQTISIQGQRQLSYNSKGAAGYHDSFFTTASLIKCRYGFASFSTDISIMTIIGSHEIAEGLTDPEYSAWTPDKGNTEIADVCEGQFGVIIVGGNTWTIQKTWSAFQRDCKVSNLTPILSPVSGDIIQYFNGPVIQHIRYVFLFLGPTWNATTIDNTGLLIYLHDLVTIFPNGCFMNILTQYGVNSAQLIDPGYIYLNLVTGIIDDNSIRSAIQISINANFIPDANNQMMYICIIDNTIDMSPSLGSDWNFKVNNYDGDKGAYYHDHFLSTSGHSCRYGVIRPNAKGIKLGDLFLTTENVNLTKVFAEIAVDPDLNGWHAVNGDGIGQVCKNLTQREAGQPDNSTQSIWDQENQSCAFYKLPTTNIASELYNNWVWRMPEYENLNPTFRGIVSKSSGQFSLKGQISNPFTQQEMYNKYIFPINKFVNNDPIYLAGVPSIPTILDLLNTLPNSFIVINQETLVLVELDNHTYSSYYLDGTTWILGTNYQTLPTVQEFTDSYKFRDQYFVLSDRTIEFRDKKIVKETYNNGLVVGINPTDPNLFHPGSFTVEKLTSVYYVWRDRQSPWGFDILTGIPQIGSNFAFNGGNITFRGRQPNTNESNDPTLINTNWSVINNFGDVQIWKTDSPDPNYTITIKKIAWTDKNGFTGVQAVPIGWTYTDLDGIIKNTGTQNTDIFPDPDGGPLIIANESYFLPYNYQYWFDKYTTGGYIAPFIKDFDVSQFHLAQAIFQGFGILDQPIFVDQGEITTLLSDFSVVSFTSDTLIIESTEEQFQINFTLVFEFVPYIVWKTIRDNYHPHIGGYELTKIKITPP